VAANETDEDKINIRVKLTNFWTLSSHYLVILQFRQTTLLFLHTLQLSRRKEELGLLGREYATRNYRFET